VTCCVVVRNLVVLKEMMAHDNIHVENKPFEEICFATETNYFAYAQDNARPGG
jgi:hypothetical protein